MYRFKPENMSRHALREARPEKIPIEMIAATYEDLGATRDSDTTSCVRSALDGSRTTASKSS